ncbi:MAG: hypothetical protein QW165_04525 [Candidatus Woesearchaeota archaeon]
MNETEQNLTEWDSSKATLMRIDATLKAASVASFMGDLLAWYKELQVLKREAYPKMPKKNTIHVNCDINPSDRKTYCRRCHCDRIFRELEGDIILLKQHKKAILPELEAKLDRAELFLRDFMDEKGMLMRDKKNVMAMFQQG